MEFVKVHLFFKPNKIVPTGHYIECKSKTKMVVALLNDCKLNQQYYHVLGIKLRVKYCAIIVETYR